MSIHERIVSMVADNSLGELYFVLIEAGGFEGEVAQLKSHLEQSARIDLNKESFSEGSGYLDSIDNIDRLVKSILRKSSERYLNK